MEEMDKGLCCIVCISPGCDMVNMHAQFKYQQAFEVTYCDRHYWMFHFHGRANTCWQHMLSVYDL